MGKSFDELAKEIQAFKAMKPEDREGKLKDEAERVENLRREIASNSEAVEEVKKRLKDAQDALETTKRRLEEARVKRQNAIALAQNTKIFDVEIKKLLLDLREQESLLEDTSIGLERRIEDLSNEKVLLKEEKVETEKMILRFRLVPYGEEWNQTAQKLAKLLEEIYDLEFLLNEPHYGGRTLTFSEGIGILSKVYLMGDERPEDRYQGRLKHIFSFEDFKFERRKIREKEEKNG